MSRATESTSDFAATHGSNGTNSGKSMHAAHAAHAAMSYGGAAATGNGGPAARPTPQPSVQPSASAQTVREFLAGKHVCPFCGTPNAVGTQPCPRCTMDDSPATRQATKSRIGPWYVLQSRNPAAPGMRFSTLLALVHKGQVSPRSVVRGPTTHQLWRFAAHVRGLSREFGLCYSCGEGVEKSSPICPHCERSQEPPASPDVLLEVRDSNGTNSQAPRNATREFELPPQPAAYPPARSPRGEHAERLRLLNSEGSVGRTRPDLRRDGRVLSAMELASALQNDEPGQSFEEGTSRFGRVVGVLVLIILVGGGVFLYLNPDYRAQVGNWVSEHWRTARAKVNSFELQKPAQKSRAPAVAGNPRSDTPARDSIIADGARAASDLSTQSVARENPNQTKPDPRQPDIKKSVDAGKTAAQIKTGDAVQEPGAGAAGGVAGAAATNPTALVPSPPPTTIASARTPDKTSQSNPQESKPQQKQSQASQPEDKKPQPPAAAPTESQRKSKSATPATPLGPPPEVAQGHNDDAPPRTESVSREEALAKARELRKKAIDAEIANDYVQSLKLWEEIKRLPKTAWPGDLEFRITFAREQIDRK